MAYVQVPRDLSKFESKVAFNLTKRQIICFGVGGILGFAFYTTFKPIIPINLLTTFMFILIAPFFIMGVFKKDGMPFEKYMYIIIRQKYLRPHIRRYKSVNLYHVIDNIQYPIASNKRKKVKK
ncbi:PrgI family protein [Peptoniphilus equinus]|uniref:PrgI family protein n=1 Tax=Peptoniphilus equinus TaxID=3016343 RepID=A0ABY7QRA5_9FIRM|nr:PrgI family protein [Peptoniphilus equinus]WBW49322.1 PrgI family protein [Peptoniphilus equinus]